LQFCWARAALASVVMTLSLHAATADSGATNAAPQAVSPSVAASTNGATATSPAKKGDSKLPADVKKALAMPDGDEKTAALAVAGTAWAQKEPAAVMSWLTEIPAPLPAGARLDVAIHCIESNGAATADVLVQRGNDELIRPLLMHWAEEDATGATKWGSKAKVPFVVRYLVFFSIGNGACKKDPTQAQTWAMNLSAQADQVAAIQGAALRLGRDNFAALTPWLMRLKPELMRAAAGAVVSDWKESKVHRGPVKDEAGLRGWVEHLPLSVGNRAMIFHAPTINAYDPKSAEPWLGPMR